jgi:hypothetical protein
MAAAAKAAGATYRIALGFDADRQMPINNFTPNVIACSTVASTAERLRRRL